MSGLSPVFIATKHAAKAEQIKSLMKTEFHSRLRVFSPPGESIAEATSADARVKAKARTAFAAVHGPVIVEQCSLVLPGVGTGLFPGTLFDTVLGQMGPEAFAATFGGQAAVVTVVGGYTEDGKDIFTFTNTLQGRVVASAAEVVKGAFGWDGLFIPAGQEAPVAALLSRGLHFNMRNAAYAHLLAHLHESAARGVYEYHVYVEPEVGADGGLAPSFMERFTSKCAELKVKPILIENCSGKFAKQPQSGKHAVGTYESVLATAVSLAAKFSEAGFVVVRTKVESGLSHPDVPETDEEAIALPQKYVEFHVKVLLPVERVAELEAMWTRDSATKVSRNLKRPTPPPGSQDKRFVNLRLYNCGKKRGLEELERRLDMLVARSFEIEGVIREYAVYDDNVVRDVGWIDSPAV